MRFNNNHYTIKMPIELLLVIDFDGDLCVRKHSWIYTYTHTRALVNVVCFLLLLRNRN